MWVLSYKFSSALYMISDSTHDTPWRAEMGERFRRGFYGKMTVVWQVSCLYAPGWWGTSMQLGKAIGLYCPQQFQVCFLSQMSIQITWLSLYQCNFAAV